MFMSLSHETDFAELLHTRIDFLETHKVQFSKLENNTITQVFTGSGHNFAKYSIILNLSWVEMYFHPEHR